MNETTLLVMLGLAVFGVLSGFIVPRLSPTPSVVYGIFAGATASGIGFLLPGYTPDLAGFLVCMGCCLVWIVTYVPSLIYFLNRKRANRQP